MKQFLAILCLLSLGTCAANNYTGHTFFSIQTPFQSASPEKESLFRDDRIVAAVDGYHGAAQIVPFGGKTRNGCSIGKFFLPFNKSTLIVGETGSNAALANEADIIANYFGILTADPTAGAGPGYNFLAGTYQSTISMNPEQTVAGVGLHYAQMFWECDDRGFWFDVAFPIVHVRNKLNFKENILDAGAGNVQPGYVGTISQALEGDTVFGDKVFNYGKITKNCCALDKTGVADVEARLGYMFVNTDDCHMTSYIGMIAPTGNKPEARHIFEPIVGNNHHWGVTLGGRSGFTLWSNECRAVSIESALHGQYLIRNTQRRSFDLIDKQWSRYIWLYPNAESTSITDIQPGINFLTQHLRVSPRFAYTLNIALVMDTELDGFEGEVGYNVYARQAEKVCLDCPWQQGPGIVGISPADRSVLHTKNNSTISRLNPVIGTIDVDFNVLTDTNVFVPITECDLNLASAAHPAVLVHTVYGAVGYHWDDMCYPPLIGVGGSYEFSDINTAFNRWNVWGKLAISF